MPDTQNDIEQAFSAGQWKITKFKKDGVQHEQFYEYYYFEFLPNNEIRIIEGTNSYSGRWKIETSDDEDDAPKTDVDFVMSFEANDKLSELAGSWQIVERNKSKLVLNKASDSAKDIDSMVFQKQ